MRLRTKLVVAVVVSAATGLAVLGAVTVSLYARSQYERLDDQVRAAVFPVARELAGDGRGPGRPSGGGAPQLFGVFGVLYGSDGVVVSQVTPVDGGSGPRIPAFESLRVGELRSVGSVSGSTQWRMVAAGVGRDGNVVVVALPEDQLSDAVAKLVVLEVVGSVVLLALLALAVWWVVRRGLRPLETMARDAERIADGAYDVRVDVAEEGTEVGALGVAFNAMLEQIETAFAARARDEERLRAFVADAAHELRTPLTSIRGFAELFRLEARPDGVDVGVMLQRIESESLRMQVLVDDLLTLARLDDVPSTTRDDVDVAALLAEASNDLRMLDPTRTVSFDADEMANVSGDAGQLRQVFTNLCTNVVRHTPAGSAVECSVAVEHDTIVASVRDHGPGVAESDRARVFDRFWQADPARVGTGSGLGLAIVAAIVREHGGTVTVETPSDGIGARFVVRLARRDSPGTPRLS